MKSIINTTLLVLLSFNMAAEAGVAVIRGESDVTSTALLWRGFMLLSSGLTHLNTLIPRVMILDVKRVLSFSSPQIRFRG